MVVSVPAVPASATPPAGPIVELQRELTYAARRAPWRVGIAIEDLATGITSGVNSTANLPAASTIKVPVIIQVFKAMQRGDIDLNTTLHVEDRDRDWGSGDLADAPWGSEKTVNQLLWLMITDSDNTATNMLIRLVGRSNINGTMAELGLRTTRLHDYIRSEGDSIRYALRTSPKEMMLLLAKIARSQMIDEWSSREMFAILDGQRHNTLLPVPLPDTVRIAHKTGSLHDTLNDVGIVYDDEEPYVIAVMTTQLPDLEDGRRFIHHVSSMTFTQLERFASWRESQGIAAFDLGQPSVSIRDALSPDEAMWNAAPDKLQSGAPSLTLPTDDGS